MEHSINAVIASTFMWDFENRAEIGFLKKVANTIVKSIYLLAICK